jgi:hypothetical protein
MPKYRFTIAERYSVWLHHERRCWLCEEPLRLAEVTIDHVIPESFLGKPVELAALLKDHDLPENFRINGFENWLPAHAHCNTAKSARVFRMVPAHQLLFDRLIRTSGAAQRTAEAVRRNVSKDKLLAKVASAIDRDAISLTDLTEFLALFGFESRAMSQVGARAAPFVKLDNGYWLRTDEIAAEGPCACERAACVDKNRKVYCYFSRHLSAWVIGKRLYHRCYDEMVQCPRCSAIHPRGHIGRAGRCAKPYSDQAHLVDTRATP